MRSIEERPSVGLPRKEEAMSSESTRIERLYPAGHRDRHMPHLCPDCGRPLKSDGVCPDCAETLQAAPGISAEWRDAPLASERTRLERMERTALRNSVAGGVP
jgi:predicted amidophosphoribosyltransferase